MRGLGARAAVLAACFSGLLLAFFLLARPWYLGVPLVALLGLGTVARVRRV